MNTRQMVTAVASTILKVAITVVVIMLVYQGAMTAYDFGYRVFKEEPMTESPGVDVQVEITMGKGVLQIGEILENKGLIRDANLFYVQNLLSHYKDQLRAGTYTLNTSMTMAEMMEIMSTVPEEDSTEGTTAQ